MEPNAVCVDGVERVHQVFSVPVTVFTPSENKTVPAGTKQWRVLLLIMSRTQGSLKIWQYPVSIAGAVIVDVVVGDDDVVGAAVSSVVVPPVAVIVVDAVVADDAAVVDGAVVVDDAVVEDVDETVVVDDAVVDGDADVVSVAPDV